MSLEWVFNVFYFLFYPSFDLHVKQFVVLSGKDLLKINFTFLLTVLTNFCWGAFKSLTSPLNIFGFSCFYVHEKKLHPLCHHIFRKRWSFFSAWDTPETSLHAVLGSVCSSLTHKHTHQEAWWNQLADVILAWRRHKLFPHPPFPASSAGGSVSLCVCVWLHTHHS